jgi:hypothetical protein
VNFRSFNACSWSATASTSAAKIMGGSLSFILRAHSFIGFQRVNGSH